MNTSMIDAYRYDEIVPVCFRQSVGIWLNKINLHKHSVTGPSAGPTLRRVIHFLAAPHAIHSTKSIVQTIFRVQAFDQHPRIQANHRPHHPNRSIKVTTTMGIAPLAQQLSNKNCKFPKCPSHLIPWCREINKKTFAFHLSKKQIKYTNPGSVSMKAHMSIFLRKWAETTPPTRDMQQPPFTYTKFLHGSPAGPLSSVAAQRALATTLLELPAHGGISLSYPTSWRMTAGKPRLDPAACLPPNTGWRARPRTSASKRSGRKKKCWTVSKHFAHVHASIVINKTNQTGIRPLPTTNLWVFCPSVCCERFFLG